MKPFEQESRPGCAAFSLFEIVVAMTILGLISGAVLSILWQAGDSAAEIRDLDRRDEEVSRFVALLRESIENLPPDGTLSMTQAERSPSGYPELKIGNSATGFIFGEIIGISTETVITVRPGKISPEGEETFDIAISRSDFQPEDTDGSGMVFGAGEDDFLQSDEEGRYWLPLLTGVTEASWNFWSEKESEWIEEWTDREKMPPLLAFSFVDNFRTAPFRVVFEVPSQISNPPPAATSQSSGSSSSSSSRTSTEQPGDSGGGRPGGGPPSGGGERPPGRGDGGPSGGGRPSGGGGPPRGGAPSGGGTGGNP